MSELRVSDADRERVAERLRLAAGEGRLTAEELEGRLERALSARTEGELVPLVADLPAGPAPASSAPRSRSPRRPDLVPFVAVSVMLVAIWALTGMGYFWPAWPILGWGSSFVMPAGRLGRRCGRRSFNPGYWTGRQRS